MGVKIWLDDRWDPRDGLGFIRCRSVDETKRLIIQCEKDKTPIELISCDYDLGDYSLQGGSGMALLNWLANRGTMYPVSIHSTHITGKRIMEDFVRQNWPQELLRNLFVSDE